MTFYNNNKNNYNINLVDSAKVDLEPASPPLPPPAA